MAKKAKHKKKLTFSDILKGNFLNREEFQSQYKYFGIIFLIPMVMIYSNHLVTKKIKKINTIKEQAEEYKSRNAYAQSKLLKIRLESELGKEMIEDSLMSLETHPKKIIIKSVKTEE